MSTDTLENEGSIVFEEPDGIFGFLYFIFPLHVEGRVKGVFV